MTYKMNETGTEGIRKFIHSSHKLGLYLADNPEALEAHIKQAEVDANNNLLPSVVISANNSISGSVRVHYLKLDDFDVEPERDE